MKLVVSQPHPLEQVHGLPEHADYPLNIDDLRCAFGDIVPSGTLTVFFRWYPNTSDVFIARSSFASAERLDSWSITVLGVEKTQLHELRNALLAETLPKLKEWFVECDRKLKAIPDEWVCFSLTVRFENQKLIHIPRETQRPGTRPTGKWPQ